MKKIIIFKVCDKIIDILYEKRRNNPQNPRISFASFQTKEMMKVFEKVSNYYELKEEDWKDAITLLKIDGFIIIENPQQEFGKLSEFKISDKGVHFKLTDSYMKRYRRWNYEKDLKAFTYYAFWLPIAISIISLSVTIHDKFMKNDTKQIQSELQEIQKATRKTPEFQVNSPVKTDTLRNQ